jgi:vitamin B12 transporter
VDYGFFQGESTFFVQLALDSIHWTYQGGAWSPHNIGKAFFFGSDTKLSVPIPLPLARGKPIRASLSYQYFLSYLLSYGYDFSSEKRIPYSPEHAVNASLEIPWTVGGRAGFGRISCRFESRKFTDTANTQILDPLFLLNLDAEQELGRGLTLFLALKNLLNVSYQSFKDYPMPGFNATVGLGMTYDSEAPQRPSPGGGG